MARQKATTLGPHELAPGLDMVLRMVDFGPVASADIRVRPITVLVGPNRAGKSYTAMALHAMVACTPSAFWPASDMPFLPPFGPRSLGPWARGAAVRVRNAFAHGPGGGIGLRLQPPAEAMYGDGWATRWAESLNALFQAEVSRLVRTGAASSMVALGTPIMERAATICSGGVSCCPATRGASLDVAWAGEGSVGYGLAVRRGRQVLLPQRPVWFAEGARFAPVLALAAGNVLAHGVPPQAHYIPAARGGIVQSYETIVAAIIQNAPMAPFGDSRMQRLPSAVATFLQGLTLAGRPQHGLEPPDSVRQIGRRAGAEILQGMVRLRGEPGEGARGGLVYEPQSGPELPLVCASSSIQAFGSMALYIGRHVWPGHLVIVEEPEAHLHPAAQRKLARYFARLVRAGVYVLVTTHSDYLVEQLSNLAMAGALDEGERRDVLGGDTDAYLAPDELGVYLFSDPCDEKGKFVGARAEELLVTPDEGVTPGDFGRVAEVMYEETTELRLRHRQRR